MTKQILICVILFASGFFLGDFTSKKKYSKKADEEIKSVKLHFESQLSAVNLKKEEVKEKPIEGKPNNSIFAIRDKKEYVDYSKPYRSEETNGNEKRIMVDALDEREKNYAAPYIIDSEEFKESDYEAITLFYYQDKVLADADYNIIQDVEGTVGLYNLEELNKSVDSGIVEIHVRNDRLGIDYEILIEEREYLKAAPRTMRILDPKDPEE